MFNKGIAPVVALSLVVVLSVGSVVTFQIWFENFSSGIFTKVEQQTDIKAIDTKIELINAGDLYFLNGFNNLTISSIKIGLNDCDFNSTSYPRGIQIINVTDCVSGIESNSKQSVVVISNKGIFSKEVIIK